MFWLFRNLVLEKSVRESRDHCRRRKRDRRESMVGEVRALIGFAYPHESHDGARRGSAAEHLLNLSDAVDDVVEFWRDHARVGVVCGVVVIFAVL